MNGMEPITDADLVSRTLAGDREAFNRIVSRYQILVCSLAYSRIGHLGQSEDVAQETFITAWRHLHLLRQPEKLRAWLCGIVRNRAKKCLEHEGRQPIHDAEPLELATNAAAPVALPSDETISQEEEAILWRSLKRMPELYREPLILFYREHQSIESVAAELDLTEDAVKQRLSRGRKLLQEEVQAFVENTLRRSTPREAFASGVLAALPVAAAPAATAAGVAGKSTLAAKGVLAAWLIPFLGIFTGFGAQWLMVRREGSHVTNLRLILSWVFVVGFAVAGDIAVRAAGETFHWSDPVFFAAMTGFWWFFAMCMATWIIPIYRHSQADARARATAPSSPPMSALRCAGIVAGTHFMMFWGIIRLAWGEHDPSGAVIIAGLMTVLGAVNFVAMRKHHGAALGPVYIQQLGSCAAMTLAIFNLRFDRWVASIYHISVAELHQRMPVWMVPALTLALLVWCVALMRMTRAKGSGRTLAA